MSMGKRAPVKSGAEQDVTTVWRKLYCYTQKAGVTSKIKRQIRRRERHNWKEENQDYE